LLKAVRNFCVLQVPVDLIFVALSVMLGQVVWYFLVMNAIVAPNLTPLMKAFHDFILPSLIFVRNLLI
jgi:hypothetical protein